MARKRRQNEMYQLIFDDPESSVPETAPAAPEVKIVSVTELTDQIRTALQKHLPDTVHVVGEISNFSQAGSGHLYFTLKDPSAQIACVMWRSKANQLKIKLVDGLAVVVHGCVDLYPLRGQYQLYVDRITLQGMGELELAFRQLKEKLEREGLFDPGRKKPLPKFPLTVAVVTSPTGAAIRDILRTLELRWPVGRVLVCPVPVQGEEAALRIAEAIRELNRYGRRFRLDVILLARGGGSLEDLWAFNEASVAYAMSESTLPIITGIGHEVDVTIADFVADHRAATPTAAAEAAVPVLSDVLTDLERNFLRLHTQFRRTMTIERGRLQILANRGMFKHPVVVLGPFAQRFDETCRRLGEAVKKIALRSRRRGHEAELKLGKITPEAVLARATNRITKLQHQLRYAARTFLVARQGTFRHQLTVFQERSPRSLVTRHAYALTTLTTGLRTRTAAELRTRTLALHHLHARLAALDHHQVLQRGFAVARREKDSKIITSIDMVGVDEVVETQFADGMVTSRVTGTERQDGPKP